MTVAHPAVDLSIILPAHNEAWRIKSCIEDVEKAAKSVCSSYEIIVSEDGSTDSTEAIVRDLAKFNQNLVFLHSPNRLGKGKAIKKALNVAKGNIIAFMDVDLSTNLSCLGKLVGEAKKKNGLVIGSRYVEGSKVNRPRSRTLFSLGYNVFVRALFLDGVRDHQCGFKAMSRNFLTAINGKIDSDGWFFDTELILKCRRMGFQLSEIGVEWTENRKRDESKIRLLRDAPKMGKDLVKFRFS